MGRVGQVERMTHVGLAGSIARVKRVAKTTADRERFSGVSLRALARPPARRALRVLPALFAAALWFAAAACSPAPPDDRDYASKIAAARAAKDAEFAGGDDPIPKAKHAEFLPLAYFPIDPDYNVPGTLKPIEDKTIYEMPTSTGAQRK